MSVSSEEQGLNAFADADEVSEAETEDVEAEYDGDCAELAAPQRRTEPAHEAPVYAPLLAELFAYLCDLLLFEHVQRAVYEGNTIVYRIDEWYRLSLCARIATL